MPEHHVHFDHDGHRFEVSERDTRGARDARGTAGAREPLLHWEVRMDGQPVLEFHGEYPYRDDDVRRRVLEWYGIQKPVR